MHRPDTVCSHVGTNRKQPALTYPGPAPWESGWREPNAHASLAESARCPPFGLRRHAQCTLPLASEVQGNCSQTWRASREPSVPRFQSTTSLTDARSPCGQSPLGCRTESLVHASGHRAISHFFPKAPRSVRVSEEPWTSSELRPRGELLRTCSSANRLCITAAVARRCRPHQWNARTEVRFPTLGSQARRSHSSTDLHA